MTSTLQIDHATFPTFCMCQTTQLKLFENKGENALPCLYATILPRIILKSQLFCPNRKTM